MVSSQPDKQGLAEVLHLAAQWATPRHASKELAGFQS